MSREPELRWTIPDSWVWTTLSELGDVVAGGTPSTKEPLYWADEVNWISPADLTGYSAKTIKRGAKSISMVGLVNSSAKVMPAGSVHFSTRAPIGYVVISSEPLATNQGFKSLIPAPGIFNEYIYYYLMASQEYARERASGTTFLELSGKAFGRLPIPLAPIATQHRIVTKIEELFSELDKGIESLKTAQAQLKVYRQAVLKHAFEGKLTAQWREEHPEAKPASELLQRILVERRRGWEESQLRKFAEKGKAPSKNWKAMYKRPVTADTTDLPLLPDSWCWSSIDQLIREPLRNGHSAVASQTDAGIPTFSISAVTAGDFSEKNIKMTSADPLKVQNLWVESDDIFVQRSNTPELVGTARRYRGENGRAIFPDLLIRIRVTSSVLSAFVELALQSVRCHAYFRHKSQGISGSMPKIDQDVVRLAAIPLPPLPEQEAIIETVEGQLIVIDHIEAEIDNQLLKADSLRQSILREAFSGQLVPQDPHDEPASVLLDRIRAEREKAVKNNHSKKTKRRKTAA